MLTVYRIFFPVVFLFFLPGLIWKLIRRSGYKKSYWERFSIFSAEKRKRLEQYRGCVWLHAVSVGETNLALTTLNRWIKEAPGKKFVLSTTTTTGQEIARNKVPEGVEVIFCPIDSAIFVGRTLNLLRPSELVIFETELWPNLVLITKKAGAKLALVNARISDKSAKGYRRFRFFFAPVLEAFDRICVQTDLDRERMEQISPNLNGKLAICGNIKFDQEPPQKEGFDYSSVFGKPEGLLTVLAASTHSPEEKLILTAFQNLKKKHPGAHLTIVPRHAERGNELENWIQESGLTYQRRSTGKSQKMPVDCLLADTTGELASFIKTADIVVMGKTFAGNDEGQNIIEPALMGRAIICGPKLKNFRQALELLVRSEAVLRTDDAGLPDALIRLADSPQERERLGKNAASAIAASKGALQKTIDILEELR